MSKDLPVGTRVMIVKSDRFGGYTGTVQGKQGSKTVVLVDGGNGYVYVARQGLKRIGGVSE